MAATSNHANAHSCLPVPVRIQLPFVVDVTAHFHLHARAPESLAAPALSFARSCKVHAARTIRNATIKLTLSGRTRQFPRLSDSRDHHARTLYFRTRVTRDSLDGPHFVDVAALKVESYDV